MLGRISSAWSRSWRTADLAGAVRLPISISAIAPTVGVVLAAVCASLTAGCAASWYAADADREVHTLLADYEDRVLGDRQDWVRYPDPQVEAPPTDGGGADVDAIFAAVFNHLAAAGKGIAEFLDAPGGDDFQVRRESGKGKLEAALVVALAGSAMCEGVGFFAASDVDHGLGKEGAGDGGAEVILTFVNGVGPDHRVDKITGEFIDQVHGVVDIGSGGTSLLGQTIQVLILADVGREGNDVGLVSIFKPLKYDGGIETS